ncbi:MAG: OsmC family protein [Acidobacteriia bacterium]|nr:OsmC family protein [Terriglobia bacterium]
MSDQPMRAEIVWNGGLQFTAGAGGHETRMDGERHAGNTPMELLMEALAGCMAIDLVHILGRMRSELKSVRAQIEGTRADSHPRRFTALNLHFKIAGKDINPADVERAIKLSRETYCSVYACLRPDTDVKITYDLGQ